MTRTYGKAYRVLVGVNYPGRGGADRRAEPGDLVDDLPARSLPWLIKQHVIEPADHPAEDTGKDTAGRAERSGT